MVIDIETLRTRLAEAEEAYHKLMIGEKEVSVSIGNFGSTTYNQTSRSALEAYISSLKAEIALAEGKQSSRRQVIKIIF